MRRFLFVLILSQAFLGARAQINPEIRWTFDTQSAAYGMAACEDLNGDGHPDIVFGCYRNDGHIYALSGVDGSLLWSFDATVPGTDQGCNDVAVLIYDVDGDGAPEVIVPSSCYARTFCFNGIDGSLRWVAQTRGSDSPPVILDLNGDGKLEILHGEFGGWVRNIDALTGATNWDIQVQTNSWIQTAPSVLDIDQDGVLDFVVATWSFQAGADHIYAFRGTDQALLWKKNISGVVYHGSAIGDLDGDGHEEILLGSYNDTLYCLDSRTGETRWTYHVGTNYTPAGPVMLADLDGDGQCEVIGSAWFRHFALNADGTVRWTYNDPQFTYSFRGAAVADINGDAYADVVFGTARGRLTGLDGSNGQPLFQVDLRAEYGDDRFEIDHAPLIADFDGDGLLDVFIAGGYGVIPMDDNFGRAYMMTLGPGHGPEWRMFQHDILRRSNACADPVSAMEVIPPATLALYPNPTASDLWMPALSAGTGYRILHASGGLAGEGVVREGGLVSTGHLPAGAYFLLLEDQLHGRPLRFVRM
jgi:outer membrane protein assembly factor BamB